MFRNFDKRLQMGIKRRTQDRIRANMEKIGVRLAARAPARDRPLTLLRLAQRDPTTAPSLDVKVISHPMQRYAVWFGGSMLSFTPEFYHVCHTKAQYEEEGPRIARYNPVFQVSM